MEDGSSKKDVVSDWVGTRYTLTHCEKAGKSYKEAMSHVAPTKKKRTMETFFRKAYQRLVNNERVSGDSVPIQEAAIEGTAGLGPGAGDVHFYAFKKQPLRSYFWYSPYRDKLVFVSHYRFKNFQNLKTNDKEKVRNNFRKHEVAK